MTNMNQHVQQGGHEEIQHLRPPALRCLGKDVFFQDSRCAFIIDLLREKGNVCLIVPYSIKSSIYVCREIK